VKGWGKKKVKQMARWIGSKTERLTMKHWEMEMEKLRPNKTD